jgi:hypothetical protein
MPFVIILTSILSTKVMFIKSSRLAKRIKKGGKDKKRGKG